MPKLADVYIVPGVTGEVTTGPGYRLRFQGGYARATDEPSLFWALRNPKCTVQPAPAYRDHVPLWQAACGEQQPAVARITLLDVPAVDGTPEVDLTVPAPRAGRK